MARYECVRCGNVDFTTNPPHLCPDLKRRLARRERQRDEVVKLLTDAYGRCEQALAESIVNRLSQLGVADDV